MPVTLTRDGAIAIVTIDNPPVNAMSHALRAALFDRVAELDADDSILAVVLTGAGKVFVGGADITEFDRPVVPPALGDVVGRIEAAQKPWVAAVQGAALGGGLELALGCRFRLAGPGASFALPEVGLGIIPGAGGTQRLPRLIGIAAALPMVAEQQTLDASHARDCGLVDALLTGDLLAEAVDFARQVVTRPLPPPAAACDLPLPDAAFWDEAAARLSRAARGNPAPLRALSAMRVGAEAGVAAGFAAERASFLELRASPEAAALRYLFFAERAALRPTGLSGVTARPLTQIGVVGGGTMGVGITAALRKAGLAVTLVERDPDALQRAHTGLESLFQTAARRSGGDPEALRSLLDGVKGATELGSLAGCDLVIEAVYEDRDVKRAVFAELAAVCRQDTVLASNTSYLDPSGFTAGLPGPDRFIGLHFFSPAQLMKLLEVIPLAQTSDEVRATVYALARRLDKIPVQSGICDGFIGNRILRRYRGEAEALLLSGVPHPQIDAAMRGFGYAMGPFEMQDLAGLDIAYAGREAARARGEILAEHPGDILVRAGRKGQKTSGGWYDYEPGSRTPGVSAEAARLLAPLLQPAREMAADLIVERLLDAMATEGQAILDEGIAATPADVDLVEVHGYGFPRWRGGPMFLTSRR